MYRVILICLILLVSIAKLYGPQIVQKAHQLATDSKELDTFEDTEHDPFTDTIKTAWRVIYELSGQ